MRKLLIVPALALTLSVGFAAKPAAALPQPTGTETLMSLQRMSCSFTFPAPTLVFVTNGNLPGVGAAGPLPTQIAGNLFLFPAGAVLARLSPSEREGLDWAFGRTHLVNGYGNFTDNFTCSATIFALGSGGTPAPITIPTAIVGNSIPAGEGFNSTTASVTVYGVYQGSNLSGTFDSFRDNENWTTLGSVANLYFTQLFWAQSIRTTQTGIICADYCDGDDIIFLNNGPIAQNDAFGGLHDLAFPTYTGSGVVYRNNWLNGPAGKLPSTDERRWFSLFN